MLGPFERSACGKCIGFIVDLIIIKQGGIITAEHVCMSYLRVLHGVPSMTIFVHRLRDKNECGSCAQHRNSLSIMIVDCACYRGTTSSERASYHSARSTFALREQTAFVIVHSLMFT